MKDETFEERARRINESLHNYFAREGQGGIMRRYGKPNRRPVSKCRRRYIFKRDKNMCRRCGATFKSGAFLTIDHIFPRTFGGDNKY